MLVFGHGCESLAALLAGSTTISCVSVDALTDLRSVLNDRPLLGLSAMSRPEASGEAGTAIGLFREAYGDTELATYGAWDYNVRRAAVRAIEYQADGVIMPGIATGELLGCFIGYLARVAQYAPRPSTPEEHEAILREFAPSSPFWDVQDRVVSPYF